MDLSVIDSAENESDELFSGNHRVSSNYGSNGILFFYTHEFLDDEQKKEIRHRSNVFQDTSVLSRSVTPLSLFDNPNAMWDTFLFCYFEVSLWLTNIVMMMQEQISCQ